MPQDTPLSNRQPSSTTPTTPDIPSIRTNIPKTSSNKLLPVVIILAILTLTGLGTSIFFGIQSSSRSSEISDLKNQLSAQNPVVVIDEDEDTTTPSAPTDQPTVVTKADILAAVPKSLSLAGKTPLNSEYDMYFILSDSISAVQPGTGEYMESPFSIALNLDDHSTSATINWDSAKALYPDLANNAQSGSKTYTNLHLSGKATDLILSGFGQAVGEETLFFLMEDGSVEYVPIHKALQENKIQSYGKLPNVENVIKFYNGGSCAKTGPGCGHDIIAQRADGSYYNLYEAIRATGNYN